MSSTVTLDIIARVAKEIKTEEAKAGAGFSAANTLNDWCAFITLHTGRAVDHNSAEAQADALLKVAAFALGAAAHVQAGEIAERHYEIARQAEAMSEAALDVFARSAVAHDKTPIDQLLPTGES